MQPSAAHSFLSPRGGEYFSAASTPAAAACFPSSHSWTCVGPLRMAYRTAALCNPFINTGMMGTEMKPCATLHTGPRDRVLRDTVFRPPDDDPTQDVAIRAPAGKPSAVRPHERVRSSRPSTQPEIVACQMPDEISVEESEYAFADLKFLTSIAEDRRQARLLSYLGNTPRRRRHVLLTIVTCRR